MIDNENIKRREQFYFEKPSLKRKEAIIAYLNEFVENHSDINGSGSLDSIYDGYTFESALERCLNMEQDEYARSLERCNSKTFLLIREYDDRIIGMLNLRWNLTEYLKKFGGNIGYSIRPTERKKGYNKINLYLGLLEAKKLGLDKVILDCTVTNVGSDKTIRALGGVLERCEIDPYDGELTNVYSIEVEKSLEKYKNIYEPFIFKDKINIIQ